MGIPVIHGGEDVNDLNFNLNDIVFKSSFKINTKSIDNVELLETLSLFNKLTKPSFEKVLPHSEVNNFSTLDTKSFEEFAYFLDDKDNSNNYGSEILNLYFKEYDVFKETLYFYANDIYKTLADESLNLDNDLLAEMRIFSKNKSYLFRIRDLETDIILLNKNEFIFYTFNNDLEKFENIDDKTYYEKGRVSKYSVSGDAITLFHFLSFISDSNIYLYRDFNVFNENKIIEPTNTQHRKKLLENASVFEIGDKLYDPNFAYNVDYQPIFYYLKKY